MNRADFQQLAEDRVRDAEALLNVGQWSGAYYLVGYAVECALKACIAKLTNQYDFPDKETAQKCYSHNVDVLLDLAGLITQRKTDTALNRTLSDNWLIVRKWDEKARYQQWSEFKARELFVAITDTSNGVLTWIKAFW